MHDKTNQPTAIAGKGHWLVAISVYCYKLVSNNLVKRKPSINHMCAATHRKVAESAAPDQ